MAFAAKKINHKLIKLVEILNDELPHDGTTLGESLDVSRNAIWKMIHRLQLNGVEISATKGKGYQLKTPLQLLGESEIISKLPTKIAEQTTTSLFEYIDSTNTYLMQPGNRQHLHLCTTERQTSGRGRFDRSWYSPFAENIYLSLCYQFQMDPSELTGLSLIIAVSIVNTLRDVFSIDDLSIKWPNDVFYKDQKLSGNLVELVAQVHGATTTVIGIGLNVNMSTDDDENISQAWTSLYNISGKHYDRNEIIAELLKELLANIELFKHEGFKPFQAQWNKCSYLYNKEISVNIGKTLHFGTAKGLTPRGQLILKTNEGETLHLNAGEVKLKWKKD